MDKKTQIHESIMAFLDGYLTNTPLDIIQKETVEISKLQYSGISARNYFNNFQDYYLGQVIQNAQINNTTPNRTIISLTKSKNILHGIAIQPNNYWMSPKIKYKSTKFNSFQPIEKELQNHFQKNSCV